jgi:hypothetical protein
MGVVMALGQPWNVALCMGYVFHPGPSHFPSAICIFHGKIGS